MGMSFQHLDTDYQGGEGPHSALQMSIVLPFDITTLINIGWSPFEVRNLAPTSDILQREVRTVSIPVSLLGRVRPSLANDTFDTFRWFTSPNRQIVHSAEEGVTISVTSVMETSTGFWGAETVERYRISVVFPQHRTVVVTRSSRDITTCIKSIAMVFPELLIPFPQTDGEVDVVTADVLCACIQFNIRYLKAFLPVVFFLLEDSVQGMAACNSAAESALSLLKGSIVMEEKRGWFSRKKQVTEHSAKEDMEFLTKQKGLRTPAGRLLRSMCDMLGAAWDMQQATSNLSTSLLGEENALERFQSELIGETLETILSPPPGLALFTEGFEVPVSNVRNVANLLDMMHPPANYILVYEDGFASLLRRLASLQRIALEHNDKYVVAWAKLCVERIDQSSSVQCDFAQRKKNQAIVQLCVLIHCLTRHLFECV